MIADSERNLKLNILLREGINRHLNRLNWSLKTLSEKSSISYETLKKLANAKIDNPSLISTFKIAKAFGITIETLMGMDSSLAGIICSFESHSSQFIRSLIKLQYACENLNSINNGCFHIPVFEPASYILDETPYISCNFSILDISQFMDTTKENISFAIKITSQNLMPYFALNDILLIISAQKIPANKICFIVHKGVVYIRKYIICPCAKFVPFTPTSSKREFLPSDDIIILGYVFKTISI